MSADIDPLELAQKDARGLWKRARIVITDWAKKYVTAALIKVLVPGATAVGLAIVALPLAAAAVCVLVIVLLMVYAINATRLLKRKDAELRWAWVANHRLHQRHLDHQIATDNAILELMGEHQRTAPFQHVPPELRSALAHVKRQAAGAVQAAQTPAVAAASTASSRRALRADRRSDRPVPSRGPELGAVKARKAAREAERAALAAEIESLATPGDVERAIKAEEAKRTQKERQDAAVAADKAARDRARAGLRPTVEEPERTITVGVAANGDGKIGSGRHPATPEQIAAGTAQDAGEGGAS